MPTCFSELPKGYAGHRSASKMTVQQFLVMRTLSSPRSWNSFNPDDYGLGERYERAQQHLVVSGAFRSFLDSITNEIIKPIGVFEGLRSQQKEFQSRDLQTKYLRSDKTPVNAFMINFGLAISRVDPAPTSVWRHSKISLKANFGRVVGETDDRGFTAVTDGQLQDISTGRIKALVECKARNRRYAEPAVEMQETGLIVAWIRECPGDQQYAPNSCFKN
ncbi:uncharacterized protein BJX67DRAFT_366635 [Aspergillus lucknowensis]|uniref:Uncharacterized protein n=1 Tax=Aspergillus lucknowensis TaxID=176173 RepID=A0ABR4LCJ7_9EURO